MLRQGEGRAEQGERVPRVGRPRAGRCIACVHGHVVGAACEGVFACDLVVAAQSTRVGFPEVNIKVTITNGSTYVDGCAETQTFGEQPSCSDCAGRSEPAPNHPGAPAWGVSLFPT